MIRKALFGAASLLLPALASTTNVQEAESFETLGQRISLSEKPATGYNKYSEFIDTSVNFVPHKSMFSQVS